MTREEIAELRARLAIERAELIEDIERRQLDIDMATTRRGPTPEVIFKVHRDNGGSNGDGAAIGDLNGDVPAVDPALLDAIAQAMVDQKAEILALVDDMLDPLRDRILTIETQINTVLSLLGAGNNVAKSLGRKRAPKLLAPPK